MAYPALPISVQEDPDSGDLSPRARALAAWVVLLALAGFWAGATVGVYHIVSS